MLKFILHIALFITPLLTPIIWLEYKIRNFKNVTYQRAEFLNEHPDSIEVLILGNSHAGDGVDPRQFDLFTYNIAQGSQSLYFDIEITEKYLEEMSRLKHVLISIDYHSLYFTHSTKRDFMYAHYFGIAYKNQYLDLIPVSLAFNGFGYERSLDMIDREPIVSIQGWWGANPNTYKRKMTAENADKRVASFDKMIMTNSSERLYYLLRLERMIQKLKARNVEVSILSLPCHELFNERLNPQTTIQNKADINKLCALFNLKHLNYQELALHDSLFYNLDHLNRKGARVISKKINEDLDSMTSN